MPPSYAPRTALTSPSPSSFYKLASMYCARSLSVSMWLVGANWYDRARRHCTVNWLSAADQLRWRQQADASARPPLAIQSLRISSQAASSISRAHDCCQWLVGLQTTVILRAAHRMVPPCFNLIHEIDLLHYWYGPITRVYAEQTTSQRLVAKGGAAITLKFASGLVGTFLLSDAVVSPHSFESGTGGIPIIPRTGKDFHRAFGSEGSSSVLDMSRWGSGENSWTRGLSETKLDMPDMKILFEAQIEHFVRVVEGASSH